jgi:hypothetical protein
VSATGIRGSLVRRVSIYIPHRTCDDSTSMACWSSYGGTDPVSGHVIEKSAFEAGFCEEQNRNSWRKCGAAPITLELP